MKTYQANVLCVTCMEPQQTTVKARNEAAAISQIESKQATVLDIKEAVSLFGKQKTTKFNTFK